MLDGRIGVEVTRLNQNFENAGSFNGLEIVEASISRMVDSLLPAMGPSKSGAGWWVSYTFRRPIDLKYIKKNLPYVLKQICHLPVEGSFEKVFTPTFTLHFDAATIEMKDHFAFGAYSDLDAGGFIASELIRNLNLRISLKEQKIAARKARYPEWWLVFVDLIGGRLPPEEKMAIRPHVRRGMFHQIILISPAGPIDPFVL
ncbi:hypothetical protein [Asticcacaulis sp. W401b]|uniref:hypothetical protein n=1 Tax=Asticcacaulis sp. W401b TaxID=3388666 RepID=UPI003970F98B